ncbi:MAG: efflux RND transporter periplasmic adaptor subunit [Bacteroidetes bacterium]|nr:efflux RND transporter periplasmic adaptor subunit [Bacteroidota bacterium]MCB9225619.1 efflux RND transporter periplasmic adaptor subunit [Chitinophagales bacterium]
MKKLYIILGILLAILLTVVIVFKDKFSGRNATQVVVEEVAKQQITESVTAYGKIYPSKEVKLSLELPGEVTKIYVNEGDSVKVGDLLLEIRADNYVSSVTQSRAAYNQAQANLQMAKARLLQAQSQFTIVENDYNRKKALFNKEILSAVEMEAAETQYLASVSELKSAKETVSANEFQVQSALAGLDQTKDNLGRTKLFAPMSGIVSKLNVEEGEKVVGTAQMAGTELITISEFSELELKVEVGENEVLRITEGDTTNITVDAYLDKKIVGLVSQVAYSSNALTDQQVTKFEVKIKLLLSSYKDMITDKNPYPFRPGMSATAEIITNKKSGVLAVPIQSVTLRDMNEDDNMDDKTQVVFVVENDKAMLKEVKTGIQDDTYIEITEGLAEGEKVVSSPFKAISKELEDETDVKLITEKELYNEE